MDEAYLTGEPYRMSKVPRFPGAVGREQRLRRACHSRYQARGGLALCEDYAGHGATEKNRPRIRRLGDQIGAIFTPIASPSL